MSQLLQVLAMMAMPAAVLLTLRYVVKRQERRAQRSQAPSLAPRK